MAATTHETPVPEFSAPPDAPPLEQGEALKSLTPEGELRDDAPLWEICHDFAAIERFVDDPNFDAAAVVGTLRAGMQEKVDRIVFLVEELKAYAKRRAARAAVILDQASAAENRAKAIMFYVEQSMKAAQFEQLPGTERKLYFKGAAPVVVPMREAVAKDFLRYGAELVKMKEATYSWNLPEVARALKDAQRVADIDFAELRPHSTLQIGEHIPATIIPKKKPSKKEGSKQ